MAQISVKRRIYPTVYAFRIEPDPESADARAKRLILQLPLEFEELVMPLNEEIIAYLRDATGPSITITDAATPPPPAIAEG